MKDKLIGWGLIVASAFLLLFNWEKYSDIYYVFFEAKAYFSVPNSLIHIAQGTMYLLLFATGIALGRSYIKQRNNKKMVKLLFVVMLITCVALALPIYRCEFYGVHHSFWGSQYLHFH